MSLAHRHLTSLGALDRAAITALLDQAQANLERGPDPQALAGRTVANLFFEPSTRTRTSFELAARRLGASVVNFDTANASTRKGETLTDTLHTLEAMQVDALVVRHARSGVPAALAKQARAGAIINAGDGNHAHPTQGLLDLLTIRQKRPDFDALTVTICGDIAHSRVARSDVCALRSVGVGAIRLCGPAALLPDQDEFPDCRLHDDFDAAIDAADVVIMLRLQAERMAQGELPEATAYHRAFGLHAARLARAKADCLVLHPGPVNRGVEISAEVVDGTQSCILQQVRNGVATRMAVLARALGRDAR